MQPTQKWITNAEKSLDKRIGALNKGMGVVAKQLDFSVSRLFAGQVCIYSAFFDVLCLFFFGQHLLSLFITQKRINLIAWASYALTW
jgi:hypothetical protein